MFTANKVIDKIREDFITKTTTARETFDNNNNQRGKIKNRGTGFFKNNNNNNNKSNNNNRQEANGTEEYNQAITVDEANTITVQRAENFSNAEITLKTIT